MLAERILSKGDVARAASMPAASVADPAAMLTLTKAIEMAIGPHRRFGLTYLALRSFGVAAAAAA
jgi:hypothetical protein